MLSARARSAALESNFTGNEMNAMPPKVSVPDDYPVVLGGSEAYRKLLDRASVDYHSTLPGSEERLLERMGNAEVVINVRSSTRFTEGVLAAAPALRLVSIWGTGTDNVDLDAARRLGVTVTNTPGVAAVAIAEHSLGLLLAVARRLPRLDAETRRGAWVRGEVVLLRGRTLGIVGLGAVGREFARIGAGIGMRVIAWTMHPDPSLGVELVELDELLATSDVVSLHLRLSPDSRGLIGASAFARMKPSAILINTARGPIVDESALIEALTNGRIAGAGLDVFDTEPLPKGHPLASLDSVVLTPHSAGIAPEVLAAGLELAVENVWRFLEGNPQHAVALPAQPRPARA
jgi:D-3-phosphoglycerate dehydrogenase